MVRGWNRSRLVTAAVVIGSLGGSAATAVVTAPHSAAPRAGVGTAADVATPRAYDYVVGRAVPVGANTGLLAADEKARTAYVLGGSSTAPAVSVVDAAAGRVTGRVAVPRDTIALAADPASDLLYLASRIDTPDTDTLLTTLDGRARRVVRSVPTEAQGQTYDLYVDSAASRVGVLGRTVDPQVVPVDPVTGKRDGRRPTNYGASVAYDPVHHDVFVAGGVLTTLGEGGPTTGRATSLGDPDAGGGGADVAVDSTTRTVWVVGNDQVFAVDPLRDQVVERVAVPGASQVAVDSGTSTVYVASRTGLTVLDGISRRITSTLAVPGSVAVDPLHHELYVLGRDTLTVVAQRRRAVAVVPAGGNGQRIDADAPGRPLRARALGVDGAPVAGVPVTFRVTAGSLRFGGRTGPTVAVVSTDASGSAASPALVGGAAGPATVTATAASDGTSAGFVAQVLPAVAADVRTTFDGSGQVQNADPGKPFARPLRAQVLDRAGLAVGGRNVVFEAFGADFAGSPTAIATTDGAGYATAPPLTASDRPGTVTVFARSADAVTGYYLLYKSGLGGDGDPIDLHVELRTRRLDADSGVGELVVTNRGSVASTVNGFFSIGAGGQFAASSSLDDDSVDEAGHISRERSIVEVEPGATYTFERAYWLTTDRPVTLSAAAQSFSGDPEPADNQATTVVRR